MVTCQAAHADDAPQPLQDIYTIIECGSENLISFCTGRKLKEIVVKVKNLIGWQYFRFKHSADRESPYWKVEGVLPYPRSSSSDSLFLLFSPGLYETAPQHISNWSTVSKCRKWLFFAVSTHFWFKVTSTKFTDLIALSVKSIL